MIMHTPTARFLAHPLAIACAAYLFATPIANASDHDKSCYDPQLLDSNAQLTSPTFLKIRDGLAYIIDNNQRDLVVVDLQAPGFPILSRTSRNWSLNHITLNDNTAYLSFGSPYGLSNGGISVWDIQDPTDPWFVRPYSTTSSPTRLLVHNDTLFYSDDLTMNVARQRAPRIEAFNTPDLPGTIIHAAGNIAYTSSLAILDITDPANPLTLAEPLPGFSATQLIVNNLFVYARSDSNITIYQHTSPTTLDQTSTITITGVTDFVLRGSILFATTPTGIQVFDVSNPNSPIAITTYTDLPGIFNPTQIELLDNTFYITDETGTLSAFNFTTNPVATHATTGIAYEIKLAGPLNNLALLATDAGMDIFDIANPQIPTKLSTFPTNNTAVGIDAAGTIAYIATHQAGLDIVDFSDPTNPTLITNFDSGRSTQDVQIVGDLAYVVDRIDGLNILDITDPSNPQLLSITDTPGWASDITIYQNGPQRLAIIPHERFDLQILDVTDPSAPTIISSFTPLNTTGTGISTATVHNGLLYTGETSRGYRVFEFSNPTFPVELTTINTDTPSEGQFAHSITIQGSRLYLANGSAGFSIYDNTDPLNPNLILNHPARDGGGGLPTSSYRRIILHDNLAYAAVFGGGFRIIDPIGCFEPCTADFNNDGSLNFFDITAFIEAFTNRDPITDLNADGRFNFFDISTFLTLYTQGCP